MSTSTCQMIEDFDIDMWISAKFMEVYHVMTTGPTEGIMVYFSILAIAIGFGVPLAVLGAAIAQGKLAASAVEAISRQPEIAGRVQMVMIVGMAFIESLVIYVLLVFFLLQGRLPGHEQMLEMVKAVTKIAG